jgi:hypothetical protein
MAIRTMLRLVAMKTELHSYISLLLGCFAIFVIIFTITASAHGNGDGDRAWDGFPEACARACAANGGLSQARVSVQPDGSVWDCACLSPEPPREAGGGREMDAPPDDVDRYGL